MPLLLRVRAMKSPSLFTFALTLLAASLPLTPAVQAGTAIQRCEAADGTVVYTDKACAALGATPRPLPSELLNRIAREQANSAPSPEYADASAPVTTVTVARRSPSAGCARSPTQLAMDLRGSLALRDVNRLAESYHWIGLSHTQSKPIMQRLDRLSSQPLEDVHYFDAQIGPGGMQLADAGAGNAAAAGVMQLMFGGESRHAVDFDVQRYAGCYFVRF